MQGITENESQYKSRCYYRLMRLSMADNTGFSIRVFSAILVLFTRKILAFCRTLLSRVETDGESMKCCE